MGLIKPEMRKKRGLRVYLGGGLDRMAPGGAQQRLFPLPGMVRSCQGWKVKKISLNSGDQRSRGDMSCFQIPGIAGSVWPPQLQRIEQK